MAHEVLVDLFKNRPELGPELLTEALGVVLPVPLRALDGGSSRAPIGKAPSRLRAGEAWS
jgi:hypothetical protein